MKKRIERGAATIRRSAINDSLLNADPHEITSVVKTMSDEELRDVVSLLVLAVQELSLHTPVGRNEGSAPERVSRPTRKIGS